MRLFIDNRSGVPIYDQIYTQIKSQIISGELEEDAPLPSIRNLAKDLRISVITTKRAYEELERSGFIYTVAGKGCFVADKNIDAVRESVMAEIEKHLEEALKLAGECGITKEQLKNMIDMLQDV
ncbi:MAG: GntR family transcriptional regulator [Clostridia bacterium]|nr:GntR family transcriptional regulator [[Bacteroides] pectinophilus]MDD5873761.1 GntR family transcriptional regulator [Clostridia bacterium]